MGPPSSPSFSTQIGTGTVEKWHTLSSSSPSLPFWGLAPLGCRCAPLHQRWLAPNPRRIEFHMRQIKSGVVTRMLPRTVRQACSQLPSTHLVPTRCHSMMIAVMRINISCPQSESPTILCLKEMSMCAATAIERSRTPRPVANSTV
jgi:hypothetical protein